MLDVKPLRDQRSNPGDLPDSSPGAGPAQPAPPPPAPPQLARRLLAEGVGTTLLVAVVVGSAGQGIDAVRPIRDAIRANVEALIAELLPDHTHQTER